MSSKLSSLFGDKLHSPRDLVAGPSQNLESLGGDVELSGTLLRKIQEFEKSRPKVDYSDFSNFVFFNSALDYFNITGEKIFNEYPYDGSSDQIQEFEDALDDYQRYVLSVWPSNTGYLKFDPSSGFSRVEVEDVGVEGTLTKTGLLNPGSGSFSFEFWTVCPPALTGSCAMVVSQKISGSSGFSVFFSGSALHMQVVSASNTDSVSTLSSPGSLVYYCMSYDRSGDLPILSVMTGSSSTFPVVAAYSTGSITGYIDTSGAKLYIGSGSLSGKIVSSFSGSLDDLRVWNYARSLSDVTSSFNTKIFSQPGLMSLWRFNEGKNLGDGDKEIVRDSSGHKINGRIVNYYEGIRGSGSLLPYDSEDLILTLNSPEIQLYIQEQQASGSLYDRTNDNQLSRMLPEEFFLMEQRKNTDVLEKFLYVLARHYDRIKVSIDQFSNVLKSDYGNFDQTPDALLQDVARFFGWEFTGNFLDADAVQYIIGKNVLSNTLANKQLEVKLHEIKNEFWKRTLINLMYIYKTKGTRASVDALLRVYGLNQNFIRLKEYGNKTNAGITTFRIHSEKSSPALSFGTGSLTGSVVSPYFSSSMGSVEIDVLFPTQITSHMTSSVTTGSIWNFVRDNSEVSSLSYTKDSYSSMTGSLVYSGSEGTLVLSGANIFDGRWYHVALVRDPLSSSLTVSSRLLDGDEITSTLTSSAYYTSVSSASFLGRYFVGSSGSSVSQMWAREFKTWEDALVASEIDDHTMNFQSYGRRTYDKQNNLSLHWKMDENVSSSLSGQIATIFDYSRNARHGSGAGFFPLRNSYDKFLAEYNFIASPDQGWNEEKIRSFDSSFVPHEEAFRDEAVVGLEFNLSDALNEDISQIISDLESFNNIVGAAANRYRDSYQDLEAARKMFFEKLYGSVNFRMFVDLLEFFDRSFITMVRRLIPARALFTGDEVVVESHMLERPKIQTNYRRKEVDIQPVGVIYLRSRR